MSGEALDAAWKRVDTECARTGWRFRGISGYGDGDWVATAEPRPAYRSVPPRYGSNPGTKWLGKGATAATPTEALEALADALAAFPAKLAPSPGSPISSAATGGTNR